MRKGFSLLELLVATLLFGMLMTILTMVFNQSSIAWRTGIAGISDLDKVRETVGQVRITSTSGRTIVRRSPVLFRSGVPMRDPRPERRSFGLVRLILVTATLRRARRFACWRVTSMLQVLERRQVTSLRSLRFRAGRTRTPPTDHIYGKCPFRGSRPQAQHL